MRTLRGKEKGQALVEYGLLVALLVLVALLAIVILKRVAGSLGYIAANPNPPTKSIAEAAAAHIYVFFTILTTIGLSMGINHLVSFQDGTIKNPAKHSAKFCLSGISFDIWGLTTVLQSQGQIPYNQQFIKSSYLGIVMVVLICIHFSLHKLCLDSERKKYWTTDQKSHHQVFLIFLTILIPTIFAYSFYVPR